MYGTVARLHLKPGMEEQLRALSDLESQLQIPGFVAQYVYRMDTDPNEMYLVVIFDSKASYTANAASAEQDARYRQMRAMLDAEPEWHDGELVYLWPSLGA